MDNTTCPCPPFQPPRPPIPDPTAKFAAALAALTRLYEEVRGKVGDYDKDIAANKTAIEKEIADRIAADAELRAALVELVTAEITTESSERKAKDAELQKAIDDIAGTEIGDLADKLKAEIRNRIAGDDAEAAQRAQLAESVSTRFEDVIAGYAEADTELAAKMAVLKELIGNEVRARVSDVSKLKIEDEHIRGELATAIATERAAREDGDRVLEEKVGAAKEEAKTYAEVVAQTAKSECLAETARVEANGELAKEELSGRIDSVSTALNSGFTKEKNERTAADEVLRNRIEEVAHTIPPSDIEERLAKETATRRENDTRLSNAISESFEDSKEFTRQKVNPIHGDIEALGQRITSETSERKSKDSDLHEEIVRTGNDAKLYTDSKVAPIHQELEELGNRITAETSERKAKDSDLCEEISQAANDAKNYADSKVADATTNLEGKIEEAKAEIERVINPIDARVTALEDKQPQVSKAEFDRKIAELETTTIAGGARIDGIEGRLKDEEGKSDELTNRADMAQLAIHTLGEKLDQECARSAAVDENHETRIRLLEAGGGGGGGGGVSPAELDEERQARIAGDNNLSDRIESEIDARTREDARTLNDAKAYADSVGVKAMHFKGSVETYAKLLEKSATAAQGDLWNVAETGANYAWTGSEWDKLSETIDLSGLATKTELETERTTRKRVDDELAARIDSIAGKTVSDYTSFYVWANDITVPVGKITEMPEEIRTALVEVYGNRVVLDDITIAKQIDPSRLHKITFRSLCHVTSACDLVVDWGDGTKTTLATAGADELSVNRITNSYGVYESQYTVSHTYAAAGKYLVTIFGRDYFCFTTVDGSNLACDVFSNRAHIASFVKNLASTYAYSNRLLYVDAAYVYPLREKSNLWKLFYKCENLFEVLSCSHANDSSNTASVFAECGNLVKHDSPSVGTMEHDDSLASCFAGCPKLEMDIAKVFPKKIQAQTVAIGSMFLNCAKLYGKVPAQFLWEDATVQWTMSTSADADGSNRTGPFYGCSDEIRSQVPLAWGGTNADIVIRPYDPVLVTATDLAQTEAQSATKLAAVVCELKSIIGGLTSRIEELEGGGGGSPKDRILLTCADNRLVYAITVVNPEGGSDPTIDVSRADSGAAEASELLFYGSDGKTYAVRIAIDPEGNPTLEVERRRLLDGEKAVTGIKLTCADDEALYVFRVIKAIDDDPVPAISPFGF